MFSESEESVKQWVEKINRSVDLLKGGSSGGSPASAGGAGGAKTPEPSLAPTHVETTSLAPSVTSDTTHTPASDSHDVETKTSGTEKSLASRSVREKVRNLLFSFLFRSNLWC